MANVFVDDHLLTIAKEAVGEGDASLLIERAVRELTDRHQTPASAAFDEAARRDAVEGLTAMGGSEPDLVAPPRRRMW